MLGTIRDALVRRHKAVVTAEALVWRYGARGVQMARHAAESPHQSKEVRRHWEEVAQIAQCRQAEVERLDTATRYSVGNRWARRAGSLIPGAGGTPNLLV